MTVDPPRTREPSGASEDAPGSLVGPIPSESVPHAVSTGSSPDPGFTPADRPRAQRVHDGAWLGGVCTGLAAHLGWPVMIFRIGFVLLAMANLLGCFVYAVLWLLMPAQPDPEQAPGLEATARSGHSRRRRRIRPADLGAVAALTLFAGGLLWLVQYMGLGVSQQVFWPLAFAGTGLALVWRTADRAQLESEPIDGPPWLAPFVGRGKLLSVLRVLLGLILMGAAVSMVIASQTGWSQLPPVLAMTALALAGVGLVVAPWVHRSRTALRVAREEKVRADARADMAAHLHDSVLQTLALIQKRPDDPKVVATLARKQERELRTWLYGDQIRQETLKAALAAAAAEIEDEREVPIEIVCVGDAPLTEALEAMVRAAREAMLNAAKHSGAPKVDVYAEADGDRVEIFVRDRGRGFDIASIKDDRMGVRGSIIARMERHGGTARIRSAPEDGTEVTLEMST